LRGALNLLFSAPLSSRVAARVAPWRLGPDPNSVRRSRPLSKSPRSRDFGESTVGGCGGLLKPLGSFRSFHQSLWRESYSVAPGSPIELSLPWKWVQDQTLMFSLLRTQGALPTRFGGWQRLLFPGTPLVSLLKPVTFVCGNSIQEPTNDRSRDHRAERSIYWQHLEIPRVVR
jgi:hypothetical protein